MTRLSYSAREKYEQCGYKYYLHYVMRYRSSLQSSALCFGNALDIALNCLLEGDNSYHKVFDSEWSKYEEINDRIEIIKLSLNKMFNNQNNFKACWNYIICEKI